MENLDNAIVFSSDRFDFTSQLPEDYNAGNRFYGRDVAIWLCERLAQAGIKAEFVDEDWGWLVVGQVAPAASFDIAVYNFNEHGEGDRPGAPEWGLWLKGFERGKLLGIVPQRRKSAVPPVVETCVLDAIRAIGAHPRPWDDGPAG